MVTGCPKCDPGDSTCPFDMSPAPDGASALERGFVNALHVGNMSAAVEILQGLAAVDLDRAATILEAIDDVATYRRVAAVIGEV